MIAKPKAWLLATRPKTLPASIGPVLLGASLSNFETEVKNYILLLLILLCALLLQVSTNLVNDYFDSIRGLDDKNRLGPNRAMQMGWLSKEELKTGIIFSFTCAFIIGTFLMYNSGLPVVLIGISSIMMAYMYTGGPIPLSYFALGEILALIFFGPIPVWGTYYILTNNSDIYPAFIGLIPGLISMSLMGINNLRDHKNDKSKGKKTIATLCGVRFSRSLIMFGVIFSIMIPIFEFTITKQVIFLMPILLFINYYRTWKKIIFGEIDKELNITLTQTGKFLFFNCLICSIGFINL